MVTKEEYMAAMAIVDAYHEQLKTAAAINRNDMEPTILDFIEHADISTRLRNVLSEIADRDPGRPIRLEEIKAFDLSLIRNIGQRSLKEFVEKRDAYLRTRRSIPVSENHPIRTAL